MHTKIITQQNDPNFLIHVIWSKTSLVVQHIHLELLLNLSYEILKKNKHNSRINISGNYKIVINSPEVCFGIKRQCAKVCCKNLITFI
jgi:NAD-dependent dihydropyrimidine dehydrogenase PreA subunit